MHPNNLHRLIRTLDLKTAIGNYPSRLEKAGGRIL
jgi:hypothetical protein